MRNDRRPDRRNTNGRRNNEGGFGLKSALYAAIIILALGLVAFFITIKVYNKNLDKAYSDIETKAIGDMQSQGSDLLDKTEEASSQIGKTANEMLDNSLIQPDNNEEEQRQEINSNEEEAQTNSENTEEPRKEEAPKQEEEKQEEPVKDPEFEKPVEGEKMKEFAQDRLVYSETLKEWVVHTGVDIKADKTTVVKAAEAGRITAIKNDPRYGITVIIEHTNGYETRYANLLTAEFVSVGEEVTKGQTIGTVGNTATFEILDDYHLHFEILKDGEYQDPVLFVEY